MLSFTVYIASDPQLTVPRRRSVLPRPFSPLQQPASSLERLIPRTKESLARYARIHLTPSESALPRNRRVTGLGSALPKSLHLKPFRIRTYEKRGRGAGVHPSRYFNPTTANFHEPSLCRFSTRTPLSLTLTGSSFVESL